jgi:predicted N-formylglutamate amidohydrolase
LLLLCEHAGFEIPEPWGGLGLAEGLLASHYAGDIGAGALTRAVADRTGAPALLARYSRLFLDYNRFPQDWGCVRPDMGGIPIPGNISLSAEEREIRETIARRPLEQWIEQDIPARRAAISIHSCTPVFDGVHRPWDIGVLWRDDNSLARELLAALARRLPDARIGNNEPYDWRQVEAFTLQRHALSRGLPCLYLEVRNDLLGEARNLSGIASALSASLADLYEWLSAPSNRR